jgi:hypothetical protein
MRRWHKGSPPFHFLLLFLTLLRYKDNLRTLLDKEQRLEQSLHELRTTHHRSLEENRFISLPLFNPSLPCVPCLSCPTLLVSSLRNEATQSREELRLERAQSQELSHRHSLLEKKYLKLVEKYQHEKDESQHETESIRSNSDHVIREMKVWFWHYTVLSSSLL